MDASSVGEAGYSDGGWVSADPIEVGRPRIIVAVPEDDPTRILGPIDSSSGGTPRRPRRQVVVGASPPPGASGFVAAPVEPGRVVSPPSSTTAAPGGPPPVSRRPRRVGRGPRRPRFTTIAAVVVVLTLVAIAAPIVFAWSQFNQIQRIDLGPVLASAANGTNYLIVGSDSRALVDPNAGDAGAFLATPVAGERADTIIVLRVGDGPAKMMSIPRDLWVTYPSTGEEGRINGAFAQGPSELVAAVSQLGIPIDHFLQIDFTSFAGIVDALGGIEIPFPYPAFDEMSGLNVEGSGPVVLDGAQAVAFVRSRQYTEVIDGSPVTDPTGDLGRIERQRAFLSALLAKLGAARNPSILSGAASALAPGLAIDDTMTFVDAGRLLWDVRGSSPESVELPVDPYSTSGGASVLSLRQPEAAAVIESFG